MFSLRCVQGTTNDVGGEVKSERVPFKRDYLRHGEGSYFAMLTCHKATLRCPYRVIRVLNTAGLSQVRRASHATEKNGSVRPEDPA